VVQTSPLQFVLLQLLIGSPRPPWPPTTADDLIEDAYEVLMEQYRSAYPTIKGGISDKLDVKYCVVSSMGRDVFASYDAEEDFVIATRQSTRKDSQTRSSCTKASCSHASIRSVSHICACF